ncbi:MAG: phosphoribosyltransferase family protein [bacterium]|nr:phosphoribosyltransferase family protein [bacterium]
MKSKFEYTKLSAGKTTSDIFLPEFISFQYAMWNFDKGGFLQDLLHDLKYNQLSGVGIDLGKALGTAMRKRKLLSKQKWLIIPVPLHQKKKKKRGYNQARKIAVGVSKSTRLSLIDENIVNRVKFTETQTGFTLEKRNINVADAFSISDRDKIEYNACLIVDDVFTTGATTFELAETLRKAGAQKIGIATVAQA